MRIITGRWVILFLLVALLIPVKNVLGYHEKVACLDIKKQISTLDKFTIEEGLGTLTMYNADGTTFQREGCTVNLVSKSPLNWSSIPRLEKYFIGNYWEEISKYGSDGFEVESRGYFRNNSNNSGALCIVTYESDTNKPLRLTCVEAYKEIYFK